MFVCLCNPVTDSQIRVCAADGCSSFREMAVKLGVAQQCGRCACHAKEVFDLARPHLPITLAKKRGGPVHAFRQDGTRGSGNTRRAHRSDAIGGATVK